MKYILKLTLSTLFIFVMAAGCDTDELHKVNLNPNAVNEINMNYFFTAAELGIASHGSQGDATLFDWRTNVRVGIYAIQHAASTGSYPGEKYFDSDMEALSLPYTLFYMDALKRTAEILTQTGEGGFMEGRLVNTREASRIIRVFEFHRLTDWFGSVPYSEANKGLEGVFQPKFDKQKDIYVDMLKELDEACAGFNASDFDYAGFKAADFIFNGDIAKWKKFGYSLMLRLAMRVSNVDAAMANTYVTKAVAGGTMASNDDNVWVGMALGPSEYTNQNGLSRTFYPGDGSQWATAFLSSTLIDQLKGTDKASTADDDPRLTIFTNGPMIWSANNLGVFRDPNPLNWIGLPPGLNGADVNNIFGGGNPVNNYDIFCCVNPKMFQDDEPYQIMNAAESEFLKAEALVRGIGSGITGTAQSHYEAGVKLAMQLYVVYDASLVVTDEQVNTYLTQYPYNEATALEQIGTQMWLSKYMMWIDLWSDWRRTGFPVLVPTNYPGNATGGTIPRKLLIPPLEAAGNPNYESGATMPDRMTTRVWWDEGAE
ncbi:MAG TPA: SusD/RagB family nutrient-binding outer membrane lipoprotein [Bacteroidales bacterium]|nr:SusD/RagB family nutrient-binding outer membrane lipoprotein [Bacteroidales bacterium]HUX95703.1 SusD/RagB family nutrient-binding outer membrane lipoprotein [Bacteroidales bacterium]